MDLFKGFKELFIGRTVKDYGVINPDKRQKIGVMVTEKDGRRLVLYQSNQRMILDGKEARRLSEILEDALMRM